MQKIQKRAQVKQTPAEIEALELDFLSQVSGGKSGKNPRDPKGFTTYIHPKTVVVVKTVRAYRGRRPSH